MSRTWTVSNPPVASFTFTPANPQTGATVAFFDTSTAPAGRTITSRAWDLDNDGQYNDGTGPGASRVFTRPGTYVVRLRVVDSANGVDMTSRTVVVGNRPPQASFLVFPANPAAGDPVSLVSTSADPDGPLVSQQWDISGDGTIDDATSPSTTASFDRPGRQTITLTVTDSDGARGFVTKLIVVGKPRPKLLSPFPVVRIAGGLSRQQHPDPDALRDRATRFARRGALQGPGLPEATGHDVADVARHQDEGVPAELPPEHRHRGPRHGRGQDRQVRQVPPPQAPGAGADGRVPRAGQQSAHEVPIVTRAAIVGLALVVVVAAFAIPYAARGGFRSGAGTDAQAAGGVQAPAGPSAGTEAVSLGAAAGIPALGAAPRAKPGPAPAPAPSAPAVPLLPPTPAPATPAPATPGPAPASPAPTPQSAPAPAPAPKPAPSSGGGGGGGGSFDDSG